MNRERVGMRISHIALLTSLFAVAAPGAATAQVAWDSPLLLPPQPPAGIGLYLHGPAYGDVGVLGTYRAPGSDIGLRLGLANDNGDNIAVYGGIDLSERFHVADEDFPLDAGWALGAGAGIGDGGVVISLPAAVLLGRKVHEDELDFTPYFSPRLTLDLLSGNNPPDDKDAKLNFSVDLGIDLDFRQGWLVRFGGTVGDHGAFALGILF